MQEGITKMFDIRVFEKFWMIAKCEGGNTKIFGAFLVDAKRESKVLWIFLSHSNEKPCEWPLVFWEESGEKPSRK